MNGKFLNMCQIKWNSKIKINRKKNNFNKTGNNQKMSPSQWLNGLDPSDSHLLKMRLKLSSIRIKHHELKRQEQPNDSRSQWMAQKMEQMDEDLKLLMDGRMENENKNKN